VITTSSCEFVRKYLFLLHDSSRKPTRIPSCGNAIFVMLPFRTTIIDCQKVPAMLAFRLVFRRYPQPWSLARPQEFLI
jgi:hypothetical protein